MKKRKSGYFRAASIACLFFLTPSAFAEPPSASGCRPEALIVTDGYLELCLPPGLAKGLRIVATDGPVLLWGRGKDLSFKTFSGESFGYPGAPMNKVAEALGTGNTDIISDGRLREDLNRVLESSGSTLLEPPVTMRGLSNVVYVRFEKEQSCLFVSTPEDAGHFGQLCARGFDRGDVLGVLAKGVLK